jgi:hypothetical protein
MVDAYGACRRFNAISERPLRLGLAPALVVGLGMALAWPKPAEALTINATFGTNDGGVSAAAQAVVNSAVAFYDATFTNPITVNIQFNNMATGLGSSNFFLYGTGYSTYRADLVANATSANDATALAHLPNTVNNPVDNTANILVKSANGRAIGANTPGLTGLNAFASCVTVVLDGCVGLNIADTTTGLGIYSLFATTEHEIDEVLGLGSALSGASAPTSPPWAEDLFRYASPGVRSYAVNGSATNPCGGGTPNAFFSIDGGTTNLDQFNNCANGGDYADWITHTPSQVQDAFTNGTGSPALNLTSPEITALDVMGYTLASGSSTTVPEPTSLILLGTGLVLAARRSRAARRR